VAELKGDEELPIRVVARSSKYLNNLIEQVHRRIKQRLRPMLGLKSFEMADIVISGIELEEKIQKRQFKIGKLGGRGAIPKEIWQAALAA
jgi:transposase-like protein